MKHNRRFAFFPKKVLLASAFGLGILSMMSFDKKDPNSEYEQKIKKIKHIVVIYMENHSFDNLYGQFKGANGISNATQENIIQLDENGKPYQYLPAIPLSSVFPTNMTNGLFNIDQYIPADQETPDVVHRYYQERAQINGGKMNKFAQYNSTRGMTMGYYKTDLLPLKPIAENYTLCDNLFHSAFGSSFLNHQWLISAATPYFPEAPETMRAKLDTNGIMERDGTVTPDGYAVNTVYSVNQPHPAAKASHLVPNQTNPTIGDRLSEKNISWAWYSGGWDSAMAGKADPTFQYHHQPFIYFKSFADGTKAKKEHLKDETEFIAAAKSGKLPAVSFIKPLGINNEHPGYSNVITGETHAVELINDVLNGPEGAETLVILTYDENGGFWDHVAPPVIDKWGPGSRIPCILISPFTKKHFVDHTQYETVSILALIEKRWGLKPLNNRDKNANPFMGAF
ncbi:alkaline phosphatase family protein [Rhizosphaericola mali]|uniref:Acid phosphatase n=1 Tax=Rhizosphaericola mali TaxID=2545455 RepID=A0A5P2G4V0_9BACT|nr:alkaline phosphatase family protein [Rhizosphaericola mali]QES90854.1 acid phosphatase [Rhizosphaericola mali]